MQYEQSCSLFVLIVLHTCVMFAFGKKHVIRLTPKLDQQGYQGDLELGDAIAEAMVDSPEACGRLCEEHSACSSVMLTGQLCMLFPLSSPNCKVLDISCFASFQNQFGSSDIYNQES